MEHNMVKIQTFRRQTSTGFITSVAQGLTGTTENKPSKQLGRDLNMMPSSSDYKSGAFTALPHCLPQTTI